jgi:DNA repair protein SbcD/Mre11
MTQSNQAQQPSPLRVLHTSDWHLGARLYQAHRLDEHRAFLSWLLTQLASLRVQVLVISGDIFDMPIPPAEAEQLYYHFLADASQLPNILKIIVVGGNHDSAARLDAPQDVLRALRIYTVGGHTSRHNLDRYLCPIYSSPSSPDSPLAVVLAVPFIHEFHLGVRVARESEAAHRVALRDAFATLYTSLADQACARWPGVPLIATGHLSCFGTQGGDFKSFIHGWRGAEDNLPPEVFDPRINYVALGHIHRPFAVDEAEPHPRIWYAGSPIPLRFDEILWEQRALLVDISGPQQPISVTSLPIPRHRSLIKLDGAPDIIEDHLRRISDTLSSLPDEPPPLVLIDAHVPSLQPSLNAQLLLKLSQQPERLRPVVLHITQTRVGHVAPQAPTPTLQRSLHDLTPEEVFVRLYQTKHGGESPPPDLLDAFRSLLSPSPHPV